MTITAVQQQAIGEVIVSLQGIRGEVMAHRADCLDREEIPAAEDWSRIARRLFSVIESLTEEFGFEHE